MPPHGFKSLSIKAELKDKLEAHANAHEKTIPEFLEALFIEHNDRCRRQEAAKDVSSETS